MTRKIKILDIIKNSRNFAEIYTKLNEIEPTSIEKGYTLELLTYYVFKLHPFYKDLCKNIWLYNDIPDNVKSLLKLPEKDMGIDLLLETHNSKYNNIQCKYKYYRHLRQT